jgi:hypothetical protein
MANPTRFNVDLTGENINNKVLDEPHTLSLNKYRSIAPVYGPYYTDTLEVVDASSNSVLIRDYHYKCLDVVGIPTAQSGKEICTIITIVSNLVSSNIRITYQALGGGYEHNYENIRRLIDTLLVDNRPITWPSILNRPTVFEPSHHLHRIGDVIGFEYLTSELERLRTAILLGDELAHNDILTYVDTKIEFLKELVRNTESYITLLGITAATDANSSAMLAMQSVSDTLTRAQQAIINLNEGLLTLQQLQAGQITAETNAIELIQQYS